MVANRPADLARHLADNRLIATSTVSQPVPQPTHTAASAAPLTNAPVSRAVKAKPPNKFSGNRSTYNAWKFSIQLFMKVTMSPEELCSAYGVALVGTYMDGRALNWFMANESLMANPTQLFLKYEQDHDIQDQVEISCGQIIALCNQPWTGEFDEYCDIFEPLATWAEQSMDSKSMLQHFMYPLPQHIKDFFLMPAHATTTHWRVAKTLIAQWLNRKDSLNRKPGSQLLSQLKQQSAGPVAMEVGAVTTPNKSSNSKQANNKNSSSGSSRRLTPEEYWSDKICEACGKKGHSKNYRGCPKHPQHSSANKGNKTYAAAVSDGDHHSPVAASPAATTTAAATTSAAAGGASASAAESTLKTQLDNIQAMLAALTSNC